MKLKGLILGDIRQQYKYGFYALYTLFTLVYIAVLRILPMQWKELCTTTLIFSDPVLIGLMFMGAIILFEKSEKVMQALAVSPISIHAYILSKVISIGLISLLSGVLIALFSGMEHSYIHLTVGIMLGSALFTLVGISLSAFISTMNNFMLIMVPTLIISVAPISVYTMGYKSGAMLLHPSISLIELMSGNISVISLMAISIWCIAMYIFVCLLRYLFTMREVSQADERRKKEGQQKLLDEEKYELLGVRNEGGLLAFLAVWEFAEFVFIEHFAVSEKARNSGIGGKMLEELARQKAGKVVLEVELPEDSLKKRRIGFYERHGFTFNEYPYIQPPMGEDRHEIPLRIMSAPEPLSEDEFQSVRTELYESVYHYVCEE